MKRRKMYSVLILLSGLVTLALNIVLYSSLPEKVALQMTLSGNTNNLIPKNIFVLIAPAILFVNYLLMRGSDKKETSKSFGVGICIFAVNIFALFINIK